MRRLWGGNEKEKRKNATGDLSAAILHLPSKSRRGRKESQGAFKVPPVFENRIRWIHDWVHVLQIHVCARAWVCPQWVQICQEQCVSLQSRQSGLSRTSFPRFPANLSYSRSSHNLPGCRKAPVSSRRVPLGGFSQMTEMTGTLLWHSQTTAKRSLNNSRHLTTAT